ncbi:hypothetical protein BCR33DRAFT_713048 [Rhizoclosmatium globosum]|uniref:THH1/TOM1/TOM3 domain-containing protein n=1 Tax=Rhizoclosmatium globosum TaxID=329046 RepID=A0A1Y2CT61_9FUNG|nr:hypothetical protein BCR33DRAFT_713048 [Rhizoclosmatium globosum]|eukprot:ORY50211.1 hypothetical protein BCR33DRAFT_713048 [Rhizoclosmatium globosum]
MNATNTTSLDEWFIEYANVELQDLWITVSVSILQLLILGALIRIEMTSKIGRKAIFSTLNVLLFVMIISNLLIMVFSQLYSVCYDPVWIVIYISLSYLFSGVLESVILIYSWIRGFPVIQLLFPKCQVYMNGFLVLFVILEIVQFLFLLLQQIAMYTPLLNDQLDMLTYISTVIPVAVNVVVILFDAFVAGFYVRYLRSVRGNDLDVEKLEILAYYGIASCIFLEIWLSGIVIYNYFVISPTLNVLKLSVSLRFYDLGPLAFMFIQLAMKWALRNEEVRRDSRKRIRIESAKMASSGQPVMTLNLEASRPSKEKRRSSGFKQSGSIKE